MSLFNLFTKKCEMCKRRTAPLRKYKNDHGKTVKICIQCSKYAERRAYKIR